MLSGLASAGSLLLAMVTAMGITRQVIVRRLEILAGFAASIREEKVCLLPPHFGKDEIGELGEHLVAMSGALHEKNERLAATMASLGRERDALAGVVGQLREAQAELTRRAELDALTGLQNRRCFNERADLELSRLRRYATPFSLILFDIDDFKKVNDTYGHERFSAGLVQAAYGQFRAEIRRNHDGFEEVDGPAGAVPV